MVYGVVCTYRKKGEIYKQPVYEERQNRNNFVT